MKYRPEIDGLRALAITSVVLFHADLPFIRGGFLGVDIFFVISGYLITTIILTDVNAGKFSFQRFYERRARRILPALFLVMATTLPLGYFLMMPDEYKNFGQSVLATAVFSNNILLSLTSDYWALVSEFKPFLHTWSLSVEEQYYAIFPVIVIALSMFRQRVTFYTLIGLTVISLAAAVWGTVHTPTAAFYLLHTRAWEILFGAIAAYLMAHSGIRLGSHWAQEGAGLVGLVAIVVSVVVLDGEYRSPGITTIIPTLGATLIILFAKDGTFAQRLLGSRPFVAIGLVSYSWYLWHQPIFAFARIYSVEPLSTGLFLALAGMSLLLAYLTWRFVERPFRNSSVVSRPAIWAFAVTGSACAIVSGYYLNATYGMAWRVFDAETRVSDMDKRIYNERVFKYKVGGFRAPDKLKLLVTGNSFGRDFVNITQETYDTSGIEVVYRDDASGCILPFKNDLLRSLYDAADVIVIASGYKPECIAPDINFANSHHKKLFYVGTKDFGYNLNWTIHLASNQRGDQYNHLPAHIASEERMLESIVPRDHFISFLSALTKGDLVQITDDRGRMLSTDRKHVTKFGAILLGERALRGSPYAEAIGNPPPPKAP